MVLFFQNLIFFHPNVSMEDITSHGIYTERLNGLTLAVYFILIFFIYLFEYSILKFIQFSFDLFSLQVQFAYLAIPLLILTELFTSKVLLLTRIKDLLQITGRVSIKYIALILLDQFFMSFN